jgi:hypothetical protein
MQGIKVRVAKKIHRKSVRGSAQRHAEGRAGQLAGQDAAYRIRWVYGVACRRPAVDWRATVRLYRKALVHLWMGRFDKVLRALD